MNASTEHLTADACARALAALVNDADAGLAQNPELQRRIDLLVDTFLAVPSTEDDRLRRTYLADRVEAECHGGRCDLVVAHIRGDN